MKITVKSEKNQRVVTFLNRHEVDFLDKLGKDALFSTGLKLSRTKIISWMIDFMDELKINGENIKSQKEFENRIKEILQDNLILKDPASHGRLQINDQKFVTQKEAKNEKTI